MPRLHISYSEIQRRVARFLGWSAPANWSAQNTADFADILNAGLTKFYYPQTINQTGFNHVWSFMRPLGVLITAADQDEYALPPDFGHMHGAINYDNQGANNGYAPIQLVNLQQIQRMRSRQNYTGHPCYAAVLTRRTDQQAPQSSHIVLQPTPDAEYKLFYEYMALADDLSETNPYPLGGDQHGATIMAAILSEAAAMIDDDTSDVHYQQFLRNLTSSIANDLRRGGDLVGYNGNRDRNVSSISRGEARGDLITGLPTYNGQTYGDS